MKNRTSVRLLGLGWFIWGMGLVLLFTELLIALPPSWSVTYRVALLSAGVASLGMAVLLWGGWAWARLGVISAHAILGLALLFLLVAAWPYAGLAFSLPPLLTPSSWSGVIGLSLFLLTLGSATAVYYLEKLPLWGRAKAPDIETPCPTCGATLRKGRCDHCDAPQTVAYFLQPALANTSRILLEFEPGLSELHIGRDVDDREGLINANENPLYQTIGRRHAIIAYDFATQSVSLSQGPTGSDVRLNRKRVFQGEPVRVGDRIQLGQVLFVVGNAEYRPVLAYWALQSRPEDKTLLTFHATHKPRWLIGRDKGCDIVLKGQEISRQHAAISYDAGDEVFYALNTSQNNLMRVNGLDVPPGKAELISSREMSIIQLAEVNFTFTPVLYTPPTGQ